jgi:hypothetical protein
MFAFAPTIDVHLLPPNLAEFDECRDVLFGLSVVTHQVSRSLRDCALIGIVESVATIEIELAGLEKADEFGEVHVAPQRAFRIWIAKSCVPSVEHDDSLPDEYGSMLLDWFSKVVPDPASSQALAAKSWTRTVRAAAAPGIPELLVYIRKRTLALDSPIRGEGGGLFGFRFG